MRQAVAASLSYTETLRRLGLRPAGGNFKHLRRYVEEIWGISTLHFDAAAARARGLAAHSRAISPRLVDVLVTGSSYSRRSLKLRLYAAGIKERRCELCGQDEWWRGRRMSLVLDHINGVADDNRLENLRIVCPNCNATLATHCGRNNRTEAHRNCARCGAPFVAARPKQRYCSARCGARHGNRRRAAMPSARKVERPSHEQLLLDVAHLSMVAVGRKYGVSDNAVRKWLRAYERAGSAPP